MLNLPNGTIAELGIAFGVAKPITAISNANPAVVSAVGHGLIARDYGILTSNWANAGRRIYRAITPTTDTFALEGLDATSVKRFPAGGGAGSVRKISSWLQIDDLISIASAGGEPTFADGSLLADTFDTEIPGNASAQRLTLITSDDMSLASYVAMRDAALTKEPVPIRLTFPGSGAVSLYYGRLFVSETPSMQKNAVMGITTTCSLVSPPVRYAA